jgi:phenylalanyl-tRNA synthetase beta chain
MNVSRRWLEDFLRRPLDLGDLTERLAMLGAPVDAVDPLHTDLSEVLVALVEEVRPHPNAERLRVCVVNGGDSERLNVVCGAANVTAGRKYPLAPVGSTLPGGVRIEQRKLRGETSQGMLCSARELGLGQDGDGILELETDAPPGTPLLDALPLADHRLVIDIGPNRPDLLGHKGIARELAASLGVPFRLPPLPSALLLDVPPVRRVGNTGIVGGVRSGTEDIEGCPRFLGAVIRGVKVAPSPPWLARRLEAVGVRSINNVVDATNYVMLELNQPTHAYDIARLRGPSVIARRARPGETITTLDGVSRTLEATMTIIADDAGPIGVAGVMGGSATEVSDETVDVFLECAYFTPSMIRRTRRTLGLSTEASYRFERGIDRWGGVEALRRCIEIVGATAGGTLAEAPVDLGPGPSNPPRIALRPSRVSHVLGVDLPWHAMERYLVSIGATLVPKPEDDRMVIEPPSWRPDLVREVDLIEEIARLHGYQNFPADLRPFRPSMLADASIENVAAQVRSGLARLGLLEVLSLPMGPGSSDSVQLANPLSSTESHLRQRLLPGLIGLVEGNWKRQVGDVRLFEIGTVFTKGEAGQPPAEERHVAAVLTGLREPRHWSATEESRFDIWDLKGHFEAAVALAVPGGTVQVEGSGWIARDSRGRVVGEARQLEADAPPWAAPLFGYELQLDPALRVPQRFAALPTTPSSERVLALVLAEGTTVQQVADLLRRAGGELLESISIESDYRGPELPAGSRSVAFRLSFRAPDRTLRDAEIDAVEKQMLETVAGELGIQRRSGGPTGSGV